MWLLLGFFLHHLASVILVSSVEDNGLAGSIFSGSKFVKPEVLAQDRITSYNVCYTKLLR